MIKNIKLFVNDNKKSFEVGKVVKEKLNQNGFNITKKNFDLAIAVGGDGAFLRMVKTNNFSTKPYYVGINAGTLGFMQEVKVDEISKFIEEIKNGKFAVDVIGIQETEVNHKEGNSRFCSLNEIVIRDENFRLLRTGISINKNEDLLENFVGDGILITTSSGSTAHNLSYGGSIVFPNFSTLQITPLGPINSKSYRTLPNSVIIPDHQKIIINPDNKNLMVTIDGENNIYQDVENITTEIANKKIKLLRFSHYNFPQKINEKLLSNEN